MPSKDISNPGIVSSPDGMCGVHDGGVGPQAALWQQTCVRSLPVSSAPSLVQSG